MLLINNLVARSRSVFKAIVPNKFPYGENERAVCFTTYNADLHINSTSDQFEAPLPNQLNPNVKHTLGSAPEILV